MKITSELVGTKLESATARWHSRDCALYALGIGAGQQDPLAELEFTTDTTPYRQQVVYPTFGVLAGAEVGVAGLVKFLDDAVDVRAMLHGEQKCEQLRPLPTAATVLVTAEISAVWDKGNAAVVETVSEVADAASGEPYTRSTQSMFFRGAGGWGGQRGPARVPAPAPEREPDEVLTAQTRPDQALLYRLTGDSNPLHLDPVAAKQAGFPRPILHGLCTYGIVGRTLLAGYADSDPSRFISLAARLSAPTMPGDTLTIDTWHQRGGEISFSVKRDNGDVLLSHGVFILQQ
ncbi:MaoC/PaaZ C-terminal domain-containing protein [Nocardia sp. R7R-8]|uniref:MaoC/PaaZ C-terminal domain-containing protein n=1 Tax=Nocardia sp. R7R-8 TaxID=3459304 RepID=UPI00403D65E9